MVDKFILYIAIKKFIRLFRIVTKFLMEKAVVNFFFWLLIKLAESHYGESLIAIEVPPSSIKNIS